MSFQQQVLQKAEEIRVKAIKYDVSMASQHVGDQGPIPYNSVRPEDYPWAEARYADIPGLFQPFADMPDPASFDPMMQDMDQVLGHLSWGSDPADPINHRIYPANKVLDNITDARTYLADWTGKAATDFHKNVLVPFPSIERNQYLALDVLATALEAQRAIWVAAQLDIADIGNKTSEALDSMDDCGHNTWPIGFTIVACVVGIMAIPVAGPVELALGAVGTAAWVAAANPPAKDKQPSDITGETAPVVIGHMRDRIAYLRGQIQSKQQLIADALTRTQTALSGHADLFSFPPQELETATAADVRSPEYMGYHT